MLKEPEEEFNRPPFERWMKEVDNKIEKRLHLSTSDLPDQNYYFWYEDGLSPHEAAEVTLENVGYYPNKPQQIMKGTVHYKNSEEREPINLKQAYYRVKDSGMMWEFHPSFTGKWSKDKDKFKQYAKQYWNYEQIYYI